MTTDLDRPADRNDQPTDLEDKVDEGVDESFPASDPPAWSGVHIGTPCPATDSDAPEQDRSREPRAAEDRGRRGAPRD